MKRLLALALLIVLGVAWVVPAQAQNNGYGPEYRRSQKAAKKQARKMRKESKKQAKSRKKAEKANRKRSRAHRYARQQ